MTTKRHLTAIILKVALLLLFVSFRPSVEAAAVIASDMSLFVPKLTVSLRGEIANGDLAKIEDAIKKLGGFPVVSNDDIVQLGREVRFEIDSPGGDLVEAMKIGRFLRRSLLTIEIQGECSSACFIVWIGAVDRGATFGSTGVKYLKNGFGLHRPRYDKKYFQSLGIESAQMQYAKLKEMVYSYFLEMGAPLPLADRMLSTPSRSIEYLDGNEALNIVGS